MTMNNIYNISIPISYIDEAPEVFRSAEKALVSLDFTTSKELFKTAVQDLPSSSIYNRVASEYISALNEAEEEKSEINNARTKEEKLVLIEKKVGNAILMSKKDTQYSVVHYNRALKFAGYNEDETMEIDNSILDARPEFNTTHNNIAILLNNRATALHMLAASGSDIHENLLRALHDAEKALEFDREYIKAHWRRGSLLLRIGRHKEAINSLKRAYSLHQSDQIATELNKAKVAWHNTQEYKLKQYVAYDGAEVPSRQDVWKAAESANMKQLLADSELRRTLFKIYQDPSSIKVLAEDAKKKEQLEDLMKNFYYDFQLEVED
jgi:tetratricopeptide (TPR) repeat protein